MRVKETLEVRLLGFTPFFSLIERFFFSSFFIFGLEGFGKTKSFSLFLFSFIWCGQEAISVFHDEIDQSQQEVTRYGQAPFSFEEGWWLFSFSAMNFDLTLHLPPNSRNRSLKLRREEITPETGLTTRGLLKVFQGSFCSDGIFSAHSLFLFFFSFFFT